jgi:hypothetical protein
MYVINRWNETFENADSRKRQRLGWLMIPSGCDSSGYIELMSYGERGVKAFGVFLAICQWSATNRQETRGRLARSGGKALSARQVAAVVRMPEAVVADALALLQDPDIAWIHEENGTSATDCRQSADDLPPSAGDLPGLCKEKEKEKDREKEKKKEKKKDDPPQAAVYPPDFVEFWESYPRRRRSGKDGAVKAWRVAIKKADAKAIIEAVKRYAESPVGSGEFAKGPAAWLNQGCWDDAPESWGIEEKKSRVFRPGPDWDGKDIYAYARSKGHDV